MSCHRYHLERPVSEEEMDRLMAEVLGEPLDTTVTLSEHSLDDVLASRSHLRVLRVLCLLGDDINLTGRDN